MSIIIECHLFKVYNELLGLDAGSTFRIARLEMCPKERCTMPLVHLIWTLVSDEKQEQIQNYL